MGSSVLEYCEKIPEGYSEGLFNSKKYGITKKLFNHGSSFKIYAQELGGNDFISMNYYIIKSGDLLRPCEMDEHKVVDFLQKVTVKKLDEM